MSILIKREWADVVFWKVDTSNATHNTEVKVEGNNITLLVNVGGRQKICQSNITIAGQFIDYSAKKKLICGNKPIDCTVYAFAESAVFDADWGLRISNVKDKETDIACTVMANGKYTFGVSDLIGFINSMGVETAETLTADDIKEKYRPTIHALISSVLAQKLAESDLYAVEASKLAIVKEIVKEGKSLTGIELKSATIAEINYINEDRAKIAAALDRVKMDYARDKVENKGLKEKLDIVGDYQQKVGKAKNDEEKKSDAKTVEEKAKRYTICKRCNTENSANAVYCSVCGEKLK